jgi:hypothetical protein
MTTGGNANSTFFSLFFSLCYHSKGNILHQGLNLLIYWALDIRIVVIWGSVKVVYGQSWSRCSPARKPAN